VIVGTRETLPDAKFCKKIAYGIYLFGENIYQKLPIFAILVAVSPHFSSHSSKIWRENANLADPPKPNFVKSLKGYTSFGKIYTKNYKFRRFWWL